MLDRSYIEKAADVGQAKIILMRTDPRRYLARSIIAGMYLSIVVFVFWSLMNDLQPTGFGKFIGSLFFGVGLSIIVLTNTELFTSNNFYLAISSYEGTTSWIDATKLWIVCWIGNLIGALIVAVLLYETGILSALPIDHALYTGAEHKVQQAAMTIFWKGVLANWIVCLAVRLALRCHDEIAKMAVLIPVVFIFLYLGGEHSIANMGTFTQALMGKNPIGLGDAGFNLVFSTLGNIVGGVVFIGLPFAYVNPPDRPELADPPIDLRRKPEHV